MWAGQALKGFQRQQVSEGAQGCGDVGERRRQEVGGRRQEVGGRRQEVGGRRQEVGGRRQEVGGRRQKRRKNVWHLTGSGID